jgi:hypothetical protein
MQVIIYKLFQSFIKRQVESKMVVPVMDTCVYTYIHTCNVCTYMTRPTIVGLLYGSLVIINNTFIIKKEICW